MGADLIFYNIGQLVTSRELEKNSGSSMENIEILENGYVAVENGHILTFGTGKVPNNLVGLNTKLIDVEGKVLSPGLIDSHTHLVHGGSRENEFSMKISGVPYLEILKNGGGILSSVSATREATAEELLSKAKNTLAKMLSFGVTAVESKSGYGLDLENEIKQLEVNKTLNLIQPVHIISTFMGAHATPKEFKDSPERFLDSVINMLPIIKEKELAEFCDVFCEKNIFSIPESKELLSKAKELGFKIKIHADEIESLGGAELAGELGAVSADHIMAISEAGIQSLKENQVIGNLLPGTSFNLCKAYAPARKLIESGVEIALSTDYNPGSCPCENLQLIMQIAASQMKMTPKEVFKAVTINAAKSIGKEDTIGSIDVGKKADFVIFDAHNIDYILYHFGTSHTQSVYIGGSLVYKK
ncbi:imidazolonepropionase [Cetobacterium sp. 2A]|uniref:imidazolonepropionase n=1 Tax=Cetobacterium sp. 2A TaxID=2754723 RepID=UPI00163CD07B|nr:imidazolonepropionase [Cetobacterium sp. 2A]MBC2855429.1 imidazolonepropionase [Cetobacterium sp. 2A]